MEMNVVSVRARTKGATLVLVVPSVLLLATTSRNTSSQSRSHMPMCGVYAASLVAEMNARNVNAATLEM
jgi:hypothetical protein